MNKDHYKTLGVSESASKDEIKKVFRRLAKKYHPDRNRGDAAAEAKFKELSEAYETLSDAKKRDEYDMMRKYGAFGGPGGQGGFGGQPGFGFSQSMHRGQPGGHTFSFDNMGDAGDLSDILGSLFGGAQSGSPFERPRRQARVQRGGDLVANISVTFMQAIKGATKNLQLNYARQKLRVRIPAGIENGGKIRLKGQGQPSLYGGGNGDLIITVRVMADKNFERKGNDIFSSVEISFVEAIQGCKKNVKTLTKTVALNIPAGTQPGTTMRLKGMGLAVGGKSGDQYVEVKVTIPKTVTDSQSQLLDEWEG